MKGRYRTEIAGRPLPFRPSMPTFASSLQNDGDDRRPVEECQRGLRKPNEDAVAVPLRVIRESVRGFAIRSRAKLKLGRDRTQNRYPFLLIAPRAERQAEGSKR